MQNIVGNSFTKVREAGRSEYLTSFLEAAAWCAAAAFTEDVGRQESANVVIINDPLKNYF